jgi:hypothetical protein
MDAGFVRRLEMQGCAKCVFVNGILAISESFLPELVHNVSGRRCSQSAMERILSYHMASLLVAPGYLNADVLPHIFKAHSFAIGSRAWASHKMVISSTIASQSHSGADRRPREMPKITRSSSSRSIGSAASSASRATSRIGSTASSSSGGRSRSAIVGSNAESPAAVGIRIAALALREQSDLRDRFMAMPHDRVVGLMLHAIQDSASKDRAIAELKARSRTVRKSCKRKLDRKDKRYLALTDLQAADTSSWVVERKGWCHLTLHSSVQIALRRNIGNFSSKEMSTVLMEDISRHTVTKAELLCGACLVASFAEFQQHNENLMALVGGDWKANASAAELTSPPILSIAAHSHISDATSSSVWRNSKLLSGLVRSAYLPECSSMGPARLSDLANEIESDFCWADLQKVLNSTVVTWGRPPPRQTNAI